MCNPQETHGFVPTLTLSRVCALSFAVFLTFPSFHAVCSPGNTHSPRHGFSTVFWFCWLLLRLRTFACKFSCICNAVHVQTFSASALGVHDAQNSTVPMLTLCDQMVATKPHVHETQRSASTNAISSNRPLCMTAKLASAMTRIVADSLKGARVPIEADGAHVLLLQTTVAWQVGSCNSCSWTSPKGFLTTTCSFWWWLWDVIDSFHTSIA